MKRVQIRLAFWAVGAALSGCAVVAIVTADKPVAVHITSNVSR